MCGYDGGAHDIMVIHKCGVHMTRSCTHQAFSATSSVRWKDLSAVSNVRYVRGLNDLNVARHRWRWLLTPAGEGGVSHLSS